MPLFVQAFEQGFRIANLSLERFELYVGVNGNPSFEAPEAVSSSLPFTYNPSAPIEEGGTVFRLVVRKRNRYNLLSFNSYIEELVLYPNNEDEIEAELDEFEAPYDIQVYDQDEGSIRIIASQHLGLTVHAPDNWIVFLSTEGVPDPETDDPILVKSLEYVSRHSSLMAIVTGLTPGTSVNLLVGAQRLLDGHIEFSALVSFELQESLEIQSLSFFGGETYEI